MNRQTVRNIAKVLSRLLTVAGAALGAFCGVVASGWGGAYVIIPLTTVVGAVMGAGVGGILRAAAYLACPPELDDL